MNRVTPILPFSASIYRLLLQTLPGVTIMAFDTALTCLVVEGKFFEILGIAAPDAIGSSLMEIMRVHSADSLLPQYRAALRGEINDYEHVADGQIYHVRVLPVRDDTDLIVAGVHIIHDITNQKCADAALREQKTLYETLVKTSLDGIMLSDNQGNTLLANPAACQIFQRPEADLLALDRSAYIDVMDERYRKATSIPAAQGGSHTKFSGLHSDGSRFPLEISASVFPAADGKMLTLTILHNLSERNQREEALHQSEARYRLLADNSSDVIIEFNKDFQWQYVSPSVERVLGYTPAEMLQLKPLELIHPDDQPGLLAEREQSRRQYIPIKSFEFRFRHKKGHWVWVDRTGMPVQPETDSVANNTPVPLGFVMTLRDVTNRHLAEDALRESETHYRSLFEKDAAAKLIVDADTSAIVEVNSAAIEFYGYSREQFKALHINDLNRLPAETILVDMAMVRSERRSLFERQHRLSNGEIRDVQVFSGPVDIAGKHYMHSIIIDVTAQHRAEKALRESEERYRSVVSALTEGVVLQTASGAIQACNAAAERILGLTPDQILGRTSIDPLWQAIHEDGSPFPGETHPAMVTLHSGKPLENVIMGVHKPDGSLTWISINSQPLTHPDEPLPYAVVATFADITERKQITDQLARSERYYRQLFGNNSAVQLLIDPDSGYVVQASDAACRYYGYTAEQMKTLQVSEINTLSKAEMEVQMALARQEQRDYLYFKHRLASGEIRDVNVFSGPVKIDNKTYLHSVVQDITEQRKTQEALRDRENTIRALVEQSYEGIMITNDQGLITEWNAALIWMTDISRSEALGRPIWDVLFDLQPDSQKSPALYDQIKQNNSAILNTSATDAAAQVIERNIVRKDDTHRVTQTTRFLIQSDTGNHLVGITRDITEQRQMINALAASESKFRTFVEQSSDGITMIDSLGFVIEWNKAREALTGLKREDVLGKFYWDVQERLISPQNRPNYDLAKTRDRIWEALRSDRSPLLNRTVDAEIQATNGTLKYIRQTIFVIQSDLGRILASVSVDITEQRQMLNALTASEEKFRAFVEQSSDGITLLDGTGRVVEWNKSREDSTGLKREEVLGQYFWDVQFRMTPTQQQNPRIYEASKAVMINALQNDQAPIFKKPVEGELFTSDGRYRTIQQRIFPIRSANGFLIGSISRDVTEDKLAERRAFDLALEKERGQLLRSFIQQASHEFRTPLTIIYSAAFLAARADDPEKRQSKAAKIEAQVHRITKLVDMLLKMTELENSAEHAPAPVNIKLIFNAARKRAATVYSETPVLHADIAADLPVVMADANDLTDAIYQLLDNAYRFTPGDGLITVSAGVITSTNQIYLKIQDSGSGISETNLPHIFETFWRQDESHTTPGFGLGLPIAQKIIDKFGGTIKVESEVARGSIFTITLPIASSSQV